MQAKNYPDEVQNTRPKFLQNQLEVFLDKENVLRCSGRLINSDFDDGQKYPILLPEKEYFTRSVTEKVRQENYHITVQHTLNEI